MSLGLPQTTAGLTIAIGPQASTIDEAGFGAVSYNLIAHITDGGTLGKTAAVDSFSPLAGDATVEQMGIFTREQQTIAFALEDGDAGQDDLLTAHNARDCVSIRMTRQNGAIIYFLVQVSAFPQTFAAGFETGTATFLHQSILVKVAAP